MLNQFVINGLFWLPEEPQRRVAGILTYNPGSPSTLELIGSLKEFLQINQFFTPEIILGISLDGRPITLYRCFEKNSRFSSGGPLVTDFIVFTILIGVHFQSPQDIKFKRMYFDFSGLREWLGINPITRGSGKRTWQIKYKKPKQIRLFSSKPYNIFVATSAKSSADAGSASIDYEHSIGVSFRSSQKLDKYLQVMSDIRNFLSLCTRGAAYPIDIDGRSSANSYRHNNRVNYRSIKVYQGFAFLPSTIEKIRKQDMLFALDSVQERSNELFQNWFSKSELLKPMYNLYFSIIYNTYLYTENEFLSLIQAIEYYHRATMPGSELPKGEHRARIKQIADNVPKEYKSWVKEKLQYSNEFTLKKRIESLCLSFSDTIGTLASDNFVTRVVDTRNYMAHYNERLKLKAAQGEELDTLAQKLRVLLELCLLKEMGFYLEEIKTIAKNNRDMNQYLNL
jgi:hypothetical protein